MRRLPALSLTLLAVVALAACSAGAAPGWTYAPAPSASAIPSGAASGAPSAAPSEAPSVAPSVAPSIAPSVIPSASAGGSAGASGGTGTTLTVKAPLNAATAGLDPTTLETAAGTPFTLTFDNEDNTTLHNLVLFNPDGKTKVAVQGDTAFFTGPGTRTYQVPALAAGTYPYKCEVHPTTMLGTLTVK